MSATLNDEGRPSWYVTLPRSEVEVLVRRNYRDRAMVEIEYAGWPDELVAARVMTPEMATPTGKHHRDPCGDKVYITRYFRLGADGAPRRYCKIRRYKPLHTVGRWPGASEALVAYEKYLAWDKKRRPWAHDEEQIATMLGTAPASAPRPALRLVVDNTRVQS
jgi:hypothetical protein